MQLFHSFCFHTNQDGSEKTEIGSVNISESESESKDDYQFITYPVHSFVKSVLLLGRIFTAYNCLYSCVFVPKEFGHIATFIKRIQNNLKEVHNQKLYFTNISHNLFVWDNNNINTLTFAPHVTQICKKANFNGRQTIIFGTTCISPYQIIWDMLHSTSEKIEIDYSEFKSNLKCFWEKVLKLEYKFIPLICQEMYGKYNGLDYIDAMIQKWCILETKDKKLYVKKCTNKIDCPPYLYQIDRFALGIIVYNYTMYVQKIQNNVKIPEYLNKYIYNCIIMED
jgi:hypothetical protein